MPTYRTHLLVCAGTGCVSCGAFAVKEALEKEIVRRGLQDEVLVVATGCNGFCERGPILMVHPDGIFYQRLTVADVPLLVEEHLLKGRPVGKFMYVPPAAERAGPQDGGHRVLQAPAAHRPAQPGPHRPGKDRGVYRLRRLRGRGQGPGQHDARGHRRRGQRRGTAGPGRRRLPDRAGSGTSAGGSRPRPNT